ncbi:MAG: hypothetical protein M3Q65_05400 [Chloroflexota bacterium]|nr:hypothetical protein [Chloroflexota bacterium]
MPGTLRQFVLVLALGLVFTLVALPAAVGAATTALFEQSGPSATINSCIYTSSPTCELAADFTVPAGATWDITRVEVASKGSTGISDNEPLTVTFYADAGGFPGAAVYSASNQTFTRISPVDFISRYRLELATPVSLGPGTYWLGLAATKVYWAVLDNGDYLAHRDGQGAWEDQVFPNSSLGDGIFGLYHVVETTPPVIVPTVTGALGSNGWYTGDVTVSWAVADPESAITSTSGCGPTIIAADTGGTTLTCTATSGGGTASQPVTIRRDATPRSSRATLPLTTARCRAAQAGVAAPRPPASPRATPPRA